MGAEGMGDSGEREAAGSAVGSQPAPVMQSWIGEVQASALGDKHRIEIRLQLYLGAWLLAPVAAGLAAPAGLPGCP